MAEIMEEYGYLLSIAIILLSTKVLGLVTKRFKLPQVVGALVAGLLIGPAVFDIIPDSSTDILTHISEIGVIVLMFAAGLETDVRELKKSGKASFIIALFGVIVPLVGGFLVAELFSRGQSAQEMTPPVYLQNLFIGIILTATSVSITVETLKEMGKLSTESGNAILGAAIIDDILGIIALTVVTSMADPEGGGNIGIVLLKIVGFLVIGGLACVGFHIFMKKWCNTPGKDLRRYVIMSFVFCLIMSFSAEAFFGVADITGAFFAGVAISNTPRCKYIETRFDTLSYLLLSPIFFASIGLKVEIPKLSSTLLLFTGLILIVALLSKVIGCGVGAKLCKYSTSDSLKIGVGMISRGEVALIIADKGEGIGLMNEEYFAPIVIMVVFTTIITPILLKFVYKDKNQAPTLAR